MAGKALALLRGVAEGDVDEADGQPAVDHALLAGPEGQGHAGAVLTHMGEEATARPVPQVEVEANIADAFEALGQRHFRARLPPQLYHQFGIAAELEAGRGQVGARLVAVQELLANLLLQPVNAGGDG